MDDVVNAMAGMNVESQSELPQTTMDVMVNAMGSLGLQSNDYRGLHSNDYREITQPERPIVGLSDDLVIGTLQIMSKHVKGIVKKLRGELRTLQFIGRTSAGSSEFEALAHNLTSIWSDPRTGYAHVFKQEFSRFPGLKEGLEDFQQSAIVLKTWACNDCITLANDINPEVEYQEPPVDGHGFPTGKYFMIVPRIIFRDKCIASGLTFLVA
eukprot:TRINITY_DN79093_c0_g1_i1.p1 TRINITY_DN79093_c0_g1~~TRINITY_DN79093_c0_g1_i1.p1  ORF type:complete len:211 (-),score=10.78 TRINITY_DN79093_c0_g1_i1:19-651(-)